MDYGHRHPASGLKLPAFASGFGNAKALTPILSPDFAVKVCLELGGSLFGLGQETAENLRQFDGFSGAEDDQPQE